MSVRARIEDALILWHTARREGALLSSLVAASATSRKRYPKGRHAYAREPSVFARFLNWLQGRGFKTNAAPPQRPNVRDVSGDLDKGEYWPSLDQNNRLMKPISDRVAFAQFMHDESRTLFGSETFVLKFRARMWPLQELLYKFVRCELAHEAGLPEDVIFEPGDRLSVRVTDEAITFSEVLIDRIATAVRLAPENVEDFEDWDEWVGRTFKVHAQSERTDVGEST